MRISYDDHMNGSEGVSGKSLTFFSFDDQVEVAPEGQRELSVAITVHHNTK